MTITLTIPGKPYAKKRPRFSRKIGRAFDPAENRVAEASIGTIAMPHFPQPIAGPVRLEVVCTFAVPPSWSKKKAAEHMHRPHLSKPDLDNIGKHILDALNRIAWVDDAQVCELSLRKSWGLVDQTVIFIGGLSCQ